MVLSRIGIFLFSLPLEYSFGYDDWAISETDTPLPEDTTGKRLSPFKRVAKFAGRFRLRK